MDKSSNINWFPGHMAKTLREMKEKLDQVDVVIETADARLPRSSRNPEIAKILENKPSILALTKIDLADPKATEAWVKHYKSEQQQVVLLDIVARKGVRELERIVEEMAKPYIERWEKRGIMGRKIRVMVVGIPNTGKSTLINTLARRQAAKAQNKPGVTRSIQWVKTEGDWLLMDMPGVLWPRLGSDHQKMALAVSGAIKDNILEIEELAYFAFVSLLAHYPELISARYKLTEDDIEAYQQDLYGLFQLAAKKRGFLLSGARPDTRRFADTLLTELRNGVIGRISFDFPDDEVDDA